MAETPKTRRPGDPIPADLVREFRKMNSFTQEQLADRLGVRGGKPVVSGWETGRTQCEGPAAEFLLHLMGSGNVAFAAAGLRAAMNAEWQRTGESIRRWRQVTAVPETPIHIETPTFVTLFPNAAINDGEHGFPFARGTLQACIGIRPAGWVGSIPVAPDEQPAYLWMLRRDLAFGYRSRFWEDSQLATAAGHVDVGYELLHAIQTALLMKRVATPAPKDLRFTFSLDLAGVRGRGLVDAVAPRHPAAVIRTWAEDDASASLSVSAADIEADPLSVGIRVVAELASQIGADFTAEASLRRVLKNRKVEPSAEFAQLFKLVRFN